MSRRKTADRADVVFTQEALGAACGRHQVTVSRWARLEPSFPGRVLVDGRWGWSVSATRKWLDRRERTQRTLVVHPHGGVRRYWQGCRCRRCRVARTEYGRVYRAQLRRRLGLS